MLNASICTMNPGRLELIHNTCPEVLCSRVTNGVCIHLHINDKLWVGIGEASKFILVQVHDEEFVGRCESHRLPGELFVEVGGVSLVPLPNGKKHVNTA